MRAKTSGCVRMRRPAMVRSFSTEFSSAQATRPEGLARPSLHVAQVVVVGAFSIAFSLKWM
mgnify:CR=1 FL=1